MEIIEKLWEAACSGDIDTLKHYYGVESNVINARYLKFGKEHSLIMGAFRNDQFETVDYLVSVGGTVTEEEKEEMETELKRVKYMEILTQLK